MWYSSRSRISNILDSYKFRDLKAKNLQDRMNPNIIRVMILEQPEKEEEELKTLFVVVCKVEVLSLDRTNNYSLH
jgi:hypothetical protein